MKKVMVFAVGSMLLLSSCGSYEATGVYTGGQFGSILGSAIGGIAGGPRGSDIGTIVGMAGGAVIGGAMGHAADRQAQEQYEQRAQQRAQQRVQRQSAQGSYDRGTYGQGSYGTGSYGSDSYGSSSDDSGFDPSGRGDDRITFDGGSSGYPSTSGTSGSSSMRGSSYVGSPSLELRNAQLIDQNRDGILGRGETARMVFEIYNHSSEPVYNVQPCVVEMTRNKHVRVSENILVESIRPHHGVRYTATISGDSWLKNGEAVIRIGVLQNGREVTSQTRDFRLVTSKR